MGYGIGRSKQGAQEELLRPGMMLEWYCLYRSTAEAEAGLLRAPATLRARAPPRPTPLAGALSSRAPHPLGSGP